jgi:hypothetical protein
MGVDSPVGLRGSRGKGALVHRTELTMVLALLSAGGCSPQLMVVPGSVEIEDPALGVRSDATLTLQNVGRRKARGLEFVVEAPFDALAEERELAAGASMDLVVSISTDEPGVHEGTLEIDALGLGMEPVLVPLRAHLLAPMLELGDDQPVCGATGEQGLLRVGLMNAGEGPLVIQRVSLSDDADGAFWGLEDPTPLTLAPQAMSWIDLSCDAGGVRPGLLSLETNDPESALVELPIYPRALWIQVHTPPDGTVWSTEEPHTAMATIEHVGDPASIYATWSSSIEGIFMAGEVTDGEAFELGDLVLGAGSHSLRLYASATDGAVARDERTLFVSTPPTAEITRPEPGTLVQEGENWTFSGVVADADEAPDGLTVRWLSDLDGELCEGIVDPHGHVGSDVLNLSAGTHAITLVVVDSLGIEGSARSDFTVNQAPVVTITSPAEGEVQQERLVLAASLSDLEDPAADLSCTWRSSQDELLGTAQGNDGTGACRLEVDGATLGGHEIAVVVEDTMGGSARATVAMMLDGPPELVISMPVPDAWRPQGGTLMLAGSTSDVADAATDLIVSYSSDQDGALGTLVPDSDGAFEADLTLAATGIHLLTVTAEDTVGSTTSQEVTVEILDCGVTTDLDGDGYSQADGDCDEANPDVYPGAIGDLGNPRGGCWGWDVVTVLGGSDDDDLGYEIAIGDLDGDGLGDLVMGAPGHDSSVGSNIGALYLLPGAEIRGAGQLYTESLVSVEGLASTNELGLDIAVLPDIDGDGTQELVASEDATTGTVFLFLGRAAWSSMDASSADVTLTAGADVYGFGQDLDGGDFDGDGIGDLVVGADEDDTNGNQAGAVYLFSGTALAAGCTSTLDADLTVYGVMDGDKLGSGVAQVGDVDGDGLDDLLASSPYADPVYSDAGLVLLYTGLGGAMASGAAPDAAAIFRGEASNSYLGREDMVGAAGDVDGDGHGDFLMVAVGYDSVDQSDAGKAYLWLGSPELLGTFEVSRAQRAFIGNSNDGFLGDSISPAGDQDGDGLGDFILGAYKDDSPASNAGRTAILHSSSIEKWGSDTPFDHADRLLDGLNSSDYAGRSVAGGVDVDGDGSSDLAVGAYGYGSGGAVYLHLNVDQTCGE